MEKHILELTKYDIVLICCLLCLLFRISASNLLNFYITSPNIINVCHSVTVCVFCGLVSYKIQQIYHYFLFCFFISLLILWNKKYFYFILKQQVTNDSLGHFFLKFIKKAWVLSAVFKNILTRKQFIL